MDNGDSTTERQRDATPRRARGRAKEAKGAGGAKTIRRTFSLPRSLDKRFRIYCEETDQTRHSAAADAILLLLRQPRRREGLDPSPAGDEEPGLLGAELHVAEVGSARESA
jgi:hypothetical protein